ncbi:MAG: hypothetical protein N2035_04020 [Chthoniobacterales bacterium]|nr:hypothetical protein [Chthoniobacterales bacterium]
MTQIHDQAHVPRAHFPLPSPELEGTTGRRKSQSGGCSKYQLMSLFEGFFQGKPNNKQCHHSGLFEMAMQLKRQKLHQPKDKELCLKLVLVNLAGENLEFFSEHLKAL